MNTRHVSGKENPLYKYNDPHVILSPQYDLLNLQDSTLALMRQMIWCIIRLQSLVQEEFHAEFAYSHLNDLHRHEVYCLSVSDGLWIVLITSSLHLSKASQYFSITEMNNQ